MAAVEVRTEPVDSGVALLDHVLDERSLVWTRGGDGVVGHGEAARIDAGLGPDRFARAAAELDRVWSSLRRDATDPHRLVAFGSFTFDPRSTGSVVVVPSHTVARRAGEAWRTVIGAIAAPAPARVTVLQG
ncbi:MAG TPA: hypothetical protein VGW10_19865, partial [Solirubrobacteraceae bacterium]|nr:hypothetical protein [Solirubrobacteraceae bacterium]